VIVRSCCGVRDPISGSYYVSERNRSTEVIQARKEIGWNLQMTSADKFLS